jgi:uncharacterized coiled-coil protein SlyX
VIGVFTAIVPALMKRQKPKAQPAVVTVRSRKSSLSFAQKSSQSSLLSGPLPPTGGTLDSDTSDIDVELWQDLARSLLEGQAAYKRIVVQHQICQELNEALAQQEFVGISQIWQELQFVLDDFEDFELPPVKVDNRLIADPSRIEDRVPSLVNTLHRFDGLDRSLFKKPEPKWSELLESQPASYSTFLASLDFNLVDMDEVAIIRQIVSVFHELAVLRFLGINDNRAAQFLLTLRGYHHPNCFEGWKLAVDHFQFVAYMLLHSEFGRTLSDIEMVAVLLFSLTTYSDPLAAFQPSPEKQARYALEVGGKCSLMSALYLAFSETQVIDSIGQLEAKTLWTTIKKLTDLSQEWKYVNSPPAVVLILLGRFSCMFRRADTAKNWANLRKIGRAHV